MIFIAESWFLSMSHLCLGQEAACRSNKLAAASPVCWHLAAILTAAAAVVVPMVAVTVKAGDIVATPSSGGAGLGLQTQVSGGPDYTITGGTVAGEKLLHSFDVFNLPEGTTATFDGAQIPGRITDIYGRILTESTRLDGSLNLVNFNGGAFTPSINLFNPNGFILGTGFSTNASSLGLFAVDGLLFGCGGAAGALAPVRSAVRSQHSCRHSIRQRVIATC